KVSGPKGEPYGITGHDPARNRNQGRGGLGHRSEHRQNDQRAKAKGPSGYPGKSSPGDREDNRRSSGGDSHTARSQDSHSAPVHQHAELSGPVVELTFNQSRGEEGWKR